MKDCPDNYTKIINEPDIYNMLLSYSHGVNEHIKSLSWDEFPIEYKILDYKPDLWTPFRTCVLLKAMSLDLTGRNADVIYEFINERYNTCFSPPLKVVKIIREMSKLGLV